jgi:hypothetical protein
MIKFFKYPKYINLIGIEFEGIYYRPDETKLIDLERRGFIEITTDSSLNYDGFDSEDYRALELKTKPLNDKELYFIIKKFIRFEADGIYNINKSCGLHFHISTKKNYQAHCQRIEFFNDVVKMFKEKYPDVYAERENNYYCNTGFEDYIEREETFYKQSVKRYHAVNYSLEGVDEIPTIEIRLYGGSYATISGLYQAIKEVVKIIGKYTRKRFEIKENIEKETGDICRFIPVNIEPLKKVNQLEVEPLRFYSKKIIKKIECNFRKFVPDKVKSFDYRFKKPEQLDPIVINYQGGY